MRDKYKPLLSSLSLSFRVKVSLIFSGALVLLAALAWRDAVELFIQRYIPRHDWLLVMFIRAIAISFIIILFLYLLDEYILGVKESDKR